MNRNFIWAMLVVAGVLFGSLSGINQKTVVQAQDAAVSDRQGEEIVAQLKQVNAQLKELNAQFRSGSAKVTVVINPPEQQ